MAARRPRTMRQPDDVVAGVDEVDLAGDAAREVGQQVQRGVADLLLRHGAVHRRALLHDAEDLAEVRDSRRCQRADGPRGNRVDADSLLAQLGGEVAHRRLERRLGHSHHVVVRQGALRAEVGERQHRAPVLHQGERRVRDGDQRIGADVEGDPEALPAGTVERLPQLLPARVRDRVHHEVELSPPLADLREDALDVRVLRHVAAKDQLGAQALRERADPLLEDLVQVGEGELGALRAKLPRDAPRDAAVVRETEDDALPAVQHAHGVPSLPRPEYTQRHRAGVAGALPRPV